MNEFMGFRAAHTYFAEQETSPAEEIKQTNERCDLILECKHQIEHWKSKLEVLEDEQATCIKLARLRIDAPGVWRSLTRRERMEKRFILAALESPELPSALSEFPCCAFPAHIRLDRDILLARVKRPDFGKNRSLFRQPEENEHEQRSAIDRYFFVPPRLRSDKEVILAILPKYPQVIECMSSDLRDDESVLMELLANHPGSTLPDNFIQHFSDRIRSSPSIWLELVVKHPLGLAALGFCSHELRNDQEFILQVITTSHRASSESETQVLRHASHRLRAVRDVVSQAVAQSGLNLKHASYQLRRDKDIVVKASMQNGIAFRYCLPGTTKEELFLDREFLLHVVSCSPNYIVKNCGLNYQNDRELILKAATHGLDWSNIPLTFLEDREFLCELIRQAPHRYLELTESTKEIFEVALAVFQGADPGDDEMLEATEQCPKLLSNREAMWVIANKANSDIISETLQFSSSEIRNDKELMLQAVKADTVAFEYCTEDLQLDIDIVMAALPTSMYLVTDVYQFENPEVVKMAIEKTEKSDLWMTHEDIFEGMWNNREVARAWLAKGGDWLHEEFPEEFEDDKELWLIVAETNWSDLEFAPESLKNDKEFMLQLMNIDGRIIREAEDLREDYDVALAAFSNNVRAVQYYCGGEDFEFICGLSKWIRRQIEEGKTFQNEIVKNIAKPSTCPLGMLNQGPELVNFYSEEISSFLGLPGSDRLQKLETASKNLLSWGL